MHNDNYVIKMSNYIYLKKKNYISHVTSDTGFINKVIIVCTFISKIDYLHVTFTTENLIYDILDYLIH